MERAEGIRGRMRKQDVRATAAGALVVALTFASAPALAHADAAPAPHDFWANWTFDPWAVVPLVSLVAVYLNGVRRLLQKSRSMTSWTWRHLLFACSIVAFLVALVSPVDGLGEALFSAHMAQHMILMLLAAPLLVAARPLAVLMHGMPTPIHRRLAAPLARSKRLRRFAGFLIRPLAATTIQLIVLLAWHAPTLFVAAQVNDGVHTAMRLSFFGAAVLFWLMIFKSASSPGLAPLAGALASAVTMKISLMSAVIILGADSAFYPEIYANPAAAWSTTALADQQFAAMVMLAPGAVVYLMATFILLWVWIDRMERRSAQIAGAYHEWHQDMAE